MADFFLRPARREDREQIIKIWSAAFGDSGEFIDAMLRCGLLDTAVGAEKDGKLRACMFAFDGLGMDGLPAAYLYALCTEEAYRGLGLGRAVAMYAAEEAVKRGAEAVFLRPGDEALERWYAEAMGAKAVARSAVENCRTAPASAKDVRDISAGEYLRLRPHTYWEPGEALISAQAVINRHYGGCFLALKDGVACVERIEGAVLVRELISDSPEQALSAIARHFSVTELAVLRESREGPPLMALPVGKRFGYLSATPPLPFTLD